MIRNVCLKTCSPEQRLVHSSSSDKDLDTFAPSKEAALARKNQMVKFIDSLILSHNGDLASVKSGNSLLFLIGECSTPLNDMI